VVKKGRVHVAVPRDGSDPLSEATVELTRENLRRRRRDGR
jgi:hypothetical protein